MWAEYNSASLQRVWECNFGTIYNCPKCLIRMDIHGDVWWCMHPRGWQLGMVTCGTELGATWGWGQLISGNIHNPIAVPRAMAALCFSLRWYLIKLITPGRTMGVMSPVLAVQLTVPTSSSEHQCENDPYRLGPSLCPRSGQSPAGHTEPSQEARKGLHCSPLPVPFTRFRHSRPVSAPACAALTKLITTHHSPAWALPCSWMGWQGNLCSLSCSVPVPQANWVHAQAASAALPHLTALTWYLRTPNWFPQAGLNISRVQNQLCSDKMFPHRHNDRNELSWGSWLILLVLALGILGEKKAFGWAE